MRVLGTATTSFAALATAFALSTGSAGAETSAQCQGRVIGMCGGFQTDEEKLNCADSVAQYCDGRADAQKQRGHGQHHPVILKKRKPVY